MSQTNEFQRNFADLQKKYDPKRQELKALGDEIDTLKKQLQRQGDKLSDVERATGPGPSTTRRNRRSALAEDAQNDFQQEMQELFNGIATKVGGRPDRLCEAAGVHAGSSTAGSSSRVRSCSIPVPSTDISKAIVDAYNLKSGVPALPVSRPGSPGAQIPRPSRQESSDPPDVLRKIARRCALFRVGSDEVPRKPRQCGPGSHFAGLTLPPGPPIIHLVPADVSVRVFFSCSGPEWSLP